MALPRLQPEIRKAGQTQTMELTFNSPSGVGALGRRAWAGRLTASFVAAPAVALGTFIIAALNQHAPYDIVAGEAARVVAGIVPLIAAGVAGLAVLRPRIGLLAMLLVTPLVDVAQISWTVGSVQVIDQTLFVVALGLGLLLNELDRRSSAAAGAADPACRTYGRPVGADSGLRSRLSLPVVALGAALAMIAIATLSTAMSPNVGQSSAVLLHGIVEPFLVAAALIVLRPTRRDLVQLLIVLSISVALGGLMNMIQSIPAMGTIGQMQLDRNRLLFSRITYFNVGLFGEMLAMTTPLLLALLLAVRKRYLRLPRPVVALLLAAVPLDVASLFLTFTKSAYLASFGGCLVLLLLFVHGWRRRSAILLAVTLASAVVIPWPALVLQAAPPLNQAYRSAMVAVVGQSRFDSWNPSTPTGKGSVMERWYATQAGIKMAIDHPLLGISLDQFGTEYAAEYKPAQAHLDLDWAHSMLPEVAAELGFPALILDLFIYAAAMFVAWRVYRSPPDRLARLLAAALLATMVAWQIAGTAFAGDMYRPWRNMASDYVTMMVLVTAAFALYRLSLAGRRAGRGMVAAG